jgi:mono/diheme cytochrome c family protein
MKRFALLLTLCACEQVGPPPIESSMRLGGVEVSAEKLNEGRHQYEFYCRSCHGPYGDGKGPLGLHQTPPARDLRVGLMKYAAVPNGSLPRDEDIARVVKRGIPGTAMLPWEIGKQELDAVVQYVKTFAPRWKTEAPGERITMGPDPWIGRAEEAAKRGEGLYYGQAGCVRCHPAYVPRARALELAGGAELRAGIETAAMTDSAYGPILATDFGRDPLRGGAEPADIYRAIAAGIGGTAMPTWKGALPEADLWALVYYVQSLKARR